MYKSQEIAKNKRKLKSKKIKAKKVNEIARLWMKLRGRTGGNV